MGNVRKFGASLAGAALVLSAVVAGGGTSAAGPDPRAQAETRNRG